MDDLAIFRQETREWLESNVPDSLKGVGNNVLEGVWGGRKPDFAHEDQKNWLDLAAERGWTAPTWPREYGGGGLVDSEAEILRQEIRRLRLPAPLIGFGLTMIGPTLLRFGSEEQKAQHIPPICRGEIRWCQGYSESGAGSDLASLSTSAVSEGDNFLINGTKIWTSYADQSDWIFALVRTSREKKKQEGITFLLIDMESHGISVSPILLISGASPFCETHFDNVRVPKQNVVHKIDSGWTVAKALLGHERNMIAEAFGNISDGKKAQSLVDYARKYSVSSSEFLEDAILRDEVAQNEMDTRAFQLTVQRSKDAASMGQQPGSESSIFKVYGTEVNQRRHDLIMRIAGPQALGWDDTVFSDGEFQRTRDWLRSRGNSIEGGTSEIQRNIIAKHVLSLPD